MAQTKFDKQVEKDAESLMFGIGRVLAGRDLDGVKRTDATFWRAGTRVLPKVEGKVRRRSYKPGWRRLSFRLALGAGVAETGYLSTRDLDATREARRDQLPHLGQTASATVLRASMRTVSSFTSTDSTATSGIDGNSNSSGRSTTSSTGRAVSHTPPGTGHFWATSQGAHSPTTVTQRASSTESEPEPKLVNIHRSSDRQPLFKLVDKRCP
ncbi:hypothetical protein [Streptomyces sp. NPDC024089]|uniref:hypothetical protein n=1 Tax=Streptomyces sp. NPDC024089 TaxID=3154328 RepID=UPI0033EF97EB